MEFAALQAFVAVADHASFSAAGDALHLTQPAVSKRIAQLETSLGSRLFERVGRRVSLTVAGQALLPQARRLLNDARELQRLIADLSGKISGHLAMGTSHHIGLHRLPKPLRYFTQQYPDVELDIRFMDSEAACRAVESGDLEVAIVTLPPDLPPKLALQPIWHDPLAFMVGPDHALCAQGEVEIEQLLKYPAVLPGGTTYTRGILDQALRGTPADLHVAMTTNYLETLHMLVATGLGWSLLPATLLDASVVSIKVHGLHLTRHLGAVTHRRRGLSNAAAAMIETCAIFGRHPDA